MANLLQITNFIVIGDHLATSGQPTVDQIVDIGEAGYDVVINLATSESENAIPDEAVQVASQGMQYVHIPVIWDDPKKTDFELFAKVLTAHADSKVFVHCVVNMRVSAFVFFIKRPIKTLTPKKPKQRCSRFGIRTACGSNWLRKF